MAYSFESLPQLENLRGKLPHDGWQPTNSKHNKTDIAIHHSLTKQGDAYSFSEYHVNNNGWPEIAYHFVLLKDGTIQYCHDLSVIGYHVGNSNSFAVGICLVGDFRNEEPTKKQEQSLRDLHTYLKKDMPNYKRTRGHSEFPGYGWKDCPSFDYEAVLAAEEEEYMDLIPSRKEDLISILKKLAEKGKLHEKHAKDLREGNLSTSNAAYLLFVLYADKFLE